MSQEAAAKLYLLSRDSISDKVLFVLEMLSILKDTELDDVLFEYKKMVSGEKTVVQVVSADSLSPKDRAAIEEKISSKYPTPIYLYIQDKDLLGGFKVVVGDDVINETVLNKIDRLQIK